MRKKRERLNFAENNLPTRNGCDCRRKVCGLSDWNKTREKLDNYFIPGSQSQESAPIQHFRRTHIQLSEREKRLAVSHWTGSFCECGWLLVGPRAETYNLAPDISGDLWKLTGTCVTQSAFQAQNCCPSVLRCKCDAWTVHKFILVLQVFTRIQSL